MYVAHRGLKENEYAGFVAAYASGFLACECDIQVTRDGQWVVCHDVTLARTAIKPATMRDEEYQRCTTLPLSALSCAEIQSIPLKYTQTPTVLLSDLLALIPQNGKLFVEIKTIEFDDTALKNLCEQLTPYLHHVMLISFCFETLVRVHALLPKGTYGLLCVTHRVSQPHWMLSEEDVYVKDMITLHAQIQRIKNKGWSGIGLELDVTSHDFIRDAHAAGLWVHGWYQETDPAHAALIVQNAVKEKVDYINVDLLI